MKELFIQIIQHLHPGGFLDNGRNHKGIGAVISEILPRRKNFRRTDKSLHPLVFSHAGQLIKRRPGAHRQQIPHADPPAPHHFLPFTFLRKNIINRIFQREIPFIYRDARSKARNTFAHRMGNVPYPLFIRLKGPRCDNFSVPGHHNPMGCQRLFRHGFIKCRQPFGRHALSFRRRPLKGLRVLAELRHFRFLGHKNI